MEFTLDPPSGEPRFIVSLDKVTNRVHLLVYSPLSEDADINVDAFLKRRGLSNQSSRLINRCSDNIDVAYVYDEKKGFFAQYRMTHMDLETAMWMEPASVQDRVKEIENCTRGRGPAADLKR